MNEDDPRNKGYPTEDGHRLPKEQKTTVRLLRSQLYCIEEHMLRLSRQSLGVSITGSDAIRSLIELGNIKARELEESK